MKQTEIRNFKKFDSENFLQDLREKPWELIKRPCQSGGGGGGGGGGGVHVARLNVKTSRSVFINASRRCQKLNENSLSLSGFRKGR